MDYFAARYDEPSFMATIRNLSRPPITEALVDLRASANLPQDAFEALAREFSADYPSLKTGRTLRAELRIENGKLIPPTTEELGFEGLHLASSDETAVVQFRRNGFTFNNLRTYMGGDRLISEALRVWERYAAAMSITVVERVALRYLNRLEMPFEQGDEFNRFLHAPVELPDGAPQTISGFLGRVNAHDYPTASDAVVTQQLERQDDKPVLLVDVDVSQTGSFGADVQGLRSKLEVLRNLKNRIFFSLLTDAAIEPYS